MRLRWTIVQAVVATLAASPAFASSDREPANHPAIRAKVRAFFYKP